MKIAILGAGSMGEWFARFAKRLDWNVTISDIKDERVKKIANELGLEASTNNKKAVEGAEIVLIAVPIKETPNVIQEVADSLEKNALLFDIASVKEEAVETMEQIDVDSELASIHPLFGPGAENLEGKNIISVPIKVGKKYRKLKKVLSNLGAQVVEMEANKHDRLMSVIQSLTHFTLLTYYSALNSMKYSEEAESLQTPLFKKLHDLTKAFLREDPKLCGDIQTENRYSSMARSSIKEACRSLDLALEAENVKFVEEIFNEARDKIGSEEIKSAYERLYEESGGEKK